MLDLLPIGDVDDGLLQHLRRQLADGLGKPCRILPERLDPEIAYHGERQQYHSSEILAHMQSWRRDGAWRLLGVANVDLYIPILTFVFGEAQVGGPCAVFSTFRLRQDFYGLPPDDGLLRARALKEAMHELGHTLQLSHCDDYRCAMAPSHAVEWIDLKESTLCEACRGRVPREISSPAL
jgi:archaemetzincin